MHIQSLIILLLTLCSLVIGRTFFNLCTLAKELLSQGFPRHEIADWLCLIHDSDHRTDMINKHNDDNSWDHGLFQINDGFWCGRHDARGFCKVSCSDLRTDDITAASRCAKKIKALYGFSAWPGWVRNCKGRQLKNHIDHCFRCIRNEL